MEKTSKRTGLAKNLAGEKNLRKDTTAKKQVPVKGIGKLGDSPKMKEILAKKLAEKQAEDEDKGDKAEK